MTPDGMAQHSNASMAAEPGYVINEEIKYKDAFIRFSEDLSHDNYDIVVNSVRNAISSSSIRVLVTQESISNIQDFGTFVASLYSLVLTVAIVLCFFSLFLSVFGNVRENSWEYGVLRSLGLSVKQLFRVYLYEAFCVVLTAIITGTCSGLVITYLLAKFTTIWTELPLRFTFDKTTYFSVVSAAIVICVVATAVPLSRLNAIDIALVLRGADIDEGGKGMEEDDAKVPQRGVKGLWRRFRVLIMD